MQIVYISNRPKMLLETLEQVTLFMPFIKQAVVCAPDHMIDQFKKPEPTLPIILVAESEILEKSQLGALKTMDHQRRNYLLRTHLARHSDLNSEFLMSDDDARPLKLLDEARYVSDGQHRNYFYYDMRRWSSNQTEFDAGQLSTCAVLEYHNLPQLSYASHMPQIINRDLFLEAADFFKVNAADQPLCEWSTYFNYALSHYPENFIAAQPYLTLCWPEHPPCVETICGAAGICI